MLENLSPYKILLASKSPRRRELLELLRVPFSVVSTGGIDESYPHDLPAHEIPEYLANKKGDAYRNKFSGKEMIITADTLVLLNDKVLGKPSGREEAIAMLHELSGKTHLVITGVSITTADKRTCFSVRTEVTFARLSDEDIAYYVDNYLPYDKAGAYGIQEWIGCIAVEKIDGSFYNVMGLPVQRLYQELKKF
ncbi:MAG: Maf family nucleotide pyrophosphatase [Muribaculaceae bacterium]|nr:Maf family nucleotide pyrophosphatase [Muribaculaceae bacterium]